MNRERYTHTLLIVLALICVGGYVYWYLNLEWEEEVVDLGPSDEAIRNPYLAVQTFIEQQGLASEFQRGFAGLADLQLRDGNLGSSDTLVLIHTYQSLSDTHLEALWRWVENGGNLIVAVDNPYIHASDQLEDELLGRLNLGLDNEWQSNWGALFVDLMDDLAEQSETDDEASDTQEQTTETAQSPPANADKNAPWQPYCMGETRLGLPWPGQLLPVTISVSDDARLYDLSDLDEFDEDELPGSFPFKSFAIGAGHIHAFAADTSFTNDAIGCFDNGFMFWQLVKEHDKVWFAVNADSPSFWQELWRLSAVGCLALLLALAGWVWQQGVRFGPIFTIDRSQRRNFIDHIRASATFLLRNQGNSPLIETLREDVLQRMHLKHTHFDRLNPAEQLEKYQQLSAMKAEDIERAMFHPLPIANKNFIGTVRRLQHLRNTL